MRAQLQLLYNCCLIRDSVVLTARAIFRSNVLATILAARVVLSLNECDEFKGPNTAAENVLSGWARRAQRDKGNADEICLPSSKSFEGRRRANKEGERREKSQPRGVLSRLKRQARERGVLALFYGN